MRSSFNNWLDNSGILNSAIIRLKSPVFAVVVIVVVFVVESTVEDDLPIVVVSSIRCVVLEVVCSFDRSVAAFSCGCVETRVASVADVSVVPLSVFRVVV